MPIDLTNPKHVHVEFTYRPVLNSARSKQEGRPIFEDLEMVFIKFVADKKKEIAAPAHERFMVDRETGEWVTYAQAFPRHYEAFTAGQAMPTQGTRLSDCAFLTPAQVKEFAALNLHTVEQLAALEGTNLQRLGMHGRTHKTKAVQYLEEHKDKALEYRLKQENDELRQRLEALESMLSSGQGATAPENAPANPFDSWPDADLKAFIKEQTGQAPRGTPSHETLVQMAESVQKEAA